MTGSASAITDHLWRQGGRLTHGTIEIVSDSLKRCHNDIVSIWFDSLQGIIEHPLADGLELLRDRFGGPGQEELPCAAILGIAAALDQVGLLKPVNHPARRDGLNVEPIGERTLIDAGESHDLQEGAHLRPGDAEGPRAFVEAAPIEARDIVDNEGKMSLVHGRAYNKCAY
jgi:hypothetical protein